MAEVVVDRVAELRRKLSEARVSSLAALEFLRGVVALSNEYPDRSEVQDLVLRALDVGDVFGSLRPVLDSLVRVMGLFPYLNAEALSLRDKLAYEMHRAPFRDEDIVLHRPQANILGMLTRGENVVLSAPTSFGKSLLIDAVIAATNPKKVVVIVPTIALIEETRARLAKRFGRSYKIVAHDSQVSGDRTIYVLTQERALDREDLGDVNFFVIDEFYKLMPSGAADNRSHLLNIAFYKLLKTGAQFYLLGPNVTGIAIESSARMEFRFVREPYNTVASEVHQVNPGNFPLVTLGKLCREIVGQTIVYCAHPRNAWNVLGQLRRSVVASDPNDPILQWAIDWCAMTYHPEWSFIAGLRVGVGVHHGRIPRALAHFVVREFNKERIRFLVCTSTLIEGVNTSARNIILFDSKISSKDLDSFTFNNIKGRSGRMFRHFVGHVYLFAPPPSDELPVVDVPILSQPMTMPSEMLVQIESGELRDELKARLDAMVASSVLPLRVLQSNRGVPVEVQNAVAEEVMRRLPRESFYFLWEGDAPSKPQLLSVVDLLWRHFNGSELVARAFESAEELTEYVLFLRTRPAIHTLVKLLTDRRLAPDEAVNRTLDRMRSWIGFHLPQKLRVLSRIINFLAEEHGWPSCSYLDFAAQVESFFYPSHLVALEEYGIPLELLRKLLSEFEGTTTLDEALVVLRGLVPSDMQLHRFEAHMLGDAISALG